MLHWYGRLFEWTEEMCRFHESRFNSLSQIKHFTRPSPIGMHFDWSSPMLVSDRSEAGDVYESNASDREDSPYGLFRSSVFISMASSLAVLVWCCDCLANSSKIIGQTRRHLLLLGQLDLVDHVVRVALFVVVW